LQHLLLASRRSCHPGGNEYSQAGSHYFHNILTSNKPGEIQGTRIAKQQNEPIRVIVYPNKSVKANLPVRTSFFDLDQDNVIITAIKKAEDSDQLIIRMYDAEGETSSVKLNSYFNLGQVYKTNIIEENPVGIDAIEVLKYGIETFAIDAK